MAKNATMLSSTKAIHRNARISRCGMTSTHLTSHSQRFSPPSSDPSTRTGYAAVLIHSHRPVRLFLLRASYGVRPAVRVIRSDYEGLVRVSGGTLPRAWRGAVALCGSELDDQAAGDAAGEDVGEGCVDVRQLARLGDHAGPAGGVQGERFREVLAGADDGADHRDAAEDGFEDR